MKNSGYIPVEDKANKFSAYFYSFLFYTLGVVVRIFTNFDQKNKVDLGGDAILIAPLHRSYWDIPLVGISVTRRCHFMGRQEIFRNVFLRKLGYFVGSFDVDRNSHVDTRAIKLALKVLKKNGVLVIFPEGTRKKDGSLGDLFEGVARISKKAKCNILPVGIKYSKGSGAMGWFRRKAELEFLDVIDCDGMDSREIMDTLKTQFLGYLQ